ncbi:uncharacterized protein LOC135466020 [Liolophura sinensis]|uniref:uncharacterized protein LOC135466020 n=1 Tax=Liolophura sinensis TaxID=3198878 RepID=UPI0031592416
MPIKKKKSGKSKKKSGKKSVSRAAGDSGGEDEGIEEPVTAISGETPPPKPTTPNKKKKKSAKKMTKSEKAMAKLDKAAGKIRESGGAFHKFISRMDRWITVYYPKAVELFQKFDEEGFGTLTYEEFKSGMYDLDAPCSTVELHLLARLLDEEDTGDIDYTKLAKGLQFVREKEQLKRNEEEGASRLILSERKLEHCACCKLGLWHPYTEKNPKYLLVEMRLVTFDNFEDHPGHVTFVIHLHATIQALIQLIRDETDIQCTTMAIFEDASRSKDAYLPEHKTLDELGFFGGSIDNPEEITLFYDYMVEFTDCPLLLCDHYFGQKH